MLNFIKRLFTPGPFIEQEHERRLREVITLNGDNQELKKQLDVAKKEIETLQGIIDSISTTNPPNLYAQLHRRISNQRKAITGLHKAKQATERSLWEHIYRLQGDLKQLKGKLS